MPSSLKDDSLRTGFSAKKPKPAHPKSGTSIGILLAIRNEFLREGLHSMIAKFGFRVYNCESSIDDFIVDEQKIQKCKLFVIDGSSPSDHNRNKNFIKEVRSRNQSAHFVILVPPDFVGSVEPAVASDASAIVATDIKAYLLVNLLQLVSQNYVVRSAADLRNDLSCSGSSVAESKVADPQPSVPPALDGKSFAGLSSREKEILLHVTRGSSNKVVARALGISEATVKIHVKGIFRKIGVVNRTQAAFYVFNQGWLRGENAGPQISATAHKTNGILIKADMTAPGS